MTTGTPTTRAAWLGAPDGFGVGPGYLNTASIGIPPAMALHELHDAVSVWAAGEAQPADYDDVVARSRAAYARLVEVAAEDVAVGPQLSLFAGQVAAGLPHGAHVVAFREDFTSLLYPLLVRARRGDIELRFVELHQLAEAIEPATHLVAFSAVQSADGAVAPLDAIAEAAHEHDALTFVDATQAAGWLPLDARRFDFVAAAAYKWLLAPRGSALMSVRRERLAELEPVAAGGAPGEDPWNSIYGPELKLAAGARRLDLSPAWLSWVGTAPALEFVEEVRVERIHAHDVALANRLRRGLGLPPSDSAMVALDAAGAVERLAEVGVRAAVRAGRVRLSFHLYNTPADVDLALEALTA